MTAPRVVAGGTLLDPAALTIGFARRFTGYKRPDLIFHDPERLARYPEHNRPTTLFCSAKIEMEIAQLPPEEAAAFLADLGIAESARVALIRASYALLGLISFLTAGEDECRAWTIPRGLSAQKAAGKVHSDIERGFIRAETVAYDDFVKAGGDMNKVKAAGAARLEGKTYLVQDGDIINFKFNV